MENNKKSNEALDVLIRILNNPSIAKLRKDGDIYTKALFDAANLLPEGHEKTALLYLARNSGANIILDKGDAVITNAIHMYIKLMGGKLNEPRTTTGRAT